MKILPFLLFLAAFILRNSAAMAAPSVAEMQPLSFGEVLVTSGAVQSIVIAPDGAESHDAGLTTLLPGHNATFRLTGFSASSIVAAMVSDTTLDRQPSGASFDITAFTFAPDAAHQVTDGAGDMVLKVGATLSTRDHTSYSDGPYRGTYTLMINY